MIKFHFAVFLCVFGLSLGAHSKTCSDFLTPLEARLNRAFQKQISLLNAKDIQVLETLIFLHLGHNSIHDFKTRGFLDFQFYSMPNYFRAGRGNDLHYKLMMHYLESTQTVIYNSKTQEIAESSTRENF